METGTTYSYLIQSLKNPTLYDIRSISADFMMRLTPDLQESLKEEIRNMNAHSSFILRRRAFNKKPETEAQMHAYVYENALPVFRSMSRVLTEMRGGIQDIQDIAIVDYDCALGLNTIAFIEYLRTMGGEELLKEVLLIDDNEACLERAELMVKSIAPSIIVRTLLKNPNDVSGNDVRLEHVMVYHLMCGSTYFIGKEKYNEICQAGRFLFSKVICYPDVIYYGDRGPYYRDYDCYEHLDFDSVIVKDAKPTNDYFDRFIDFSESIAGSHFKDDYCKEVSEFIRRRVGFERDCVEFFCRYRNSSILARVNYAKCLYYGIDSHEDKAEAYDLMLQLKKRFEDIDQPNANDDVIKSSILGIMIDCLAQNEDGRDERIALMREFLTLNINEHDKCKVRYNYSLLLDDKSDFNTVKTLLECCVEHGCWKCHEASNYDLTKRNCPRAQYRLGKILFNHNDDDSSIQYLQAASLQGEALAMNVLGIRYDKGKGVEQDKDKALSLYMSSAENGSIAACRNAYYILSSKDRTKALWFLALACNRKDIKAEKELLSFITTFAHGVSGKKIVENLIIKSAEDGLEENKNRAIDILMRRAEDYILKDMYDEAEDEYKRIGVFDANLSEKKLDELWDNTPEWYYARKDAQMEETYTIEDSLRDALDDEPSAAWNLD